ncbi:MAG: ATP synthase F1 subunit gamma [Proteobacteria bacterium]|nr:ATP synthase F1 subunit gamma [Pseudomonadota bacterium]
MANLRDIKRRIKSVKNTQQITKAMKMVAAAKLKRAQDEITEARPYAEKMAELTNSLAAKTSAESHPLLSGIGGPKVGVILVTSDRGLCGGFNTVLIRTMDNFLKEEEVSEPSMFLVGKRAGDHYRRRNANIIDARVAGNGRPQYSAAVEIATEMITRFLNGELDEVHLVYSEFKSALTQIPKVQRLLPLAATEEPEESVAKGAATEEGPSEILYEPSSEAVLASLLPKYVEVQIFRALLESSASEHGARMTAMDSASKNAKEMIAKLTLQYNRIRQAAITTELMEIISGAESLKG